MKGSAEEEEDERAAGTRGAGEGGMKIEDGGVSRDEEAAEEVEGVGTVEEARMNWRCG